MKKTRRGMALLLAVVMTFTLLPLTAAAAGDTHEVQQSDSLALLQGELDNGNSLYFPAGTYAYTGSLHVGTGQATLTTAAEASVTITPAAGQAGITVDKTEGAAGSVTFAGSGTITIDGKNTTEGLACGIDCAGTFNLTGGTLTVQNTTGYGIGGDGQCEDFNMTGGTLNINHCGWLDAEGGFIWDHNVCNFTAGTLNIADCGHTEFGCIYTECPVNIGSNEQGAAAMTVNLTTSASGTADMKNAIVSNDTLTVKKSAVVNITLTGGTGQKRGLNTGGANVIIDGGTFYVTDQSTTAAETCGIRGANITVENGGVLDVEGTKYGVAARFPDGTLTVLGGSIVTMKTTAALYGDSTELANTITGSSVKMDDAYSIVNGLRKAAAADKVQNTPVNAAGEALTRFDLAGMADTEIQIAADPSNTAGHPAYTYSIAEDHDGTAYVWAPAVTATFWQSRDACTAGDSTKIVQTDTTIRGKTIGFVGGSAPDAAKLAIPAGQALAYWINAETGAAFDPETDTLAKNTDLYPVLRPTTDMPLDLLVKKGADTSYDTENAALFKVRQGDTVDYKAVLDITVIRTQMTGVETVMGQLGVTADQYPLITLDYPSSAITNTLTATIRIPAGLRFDASGLRLEDNALYAQGAVTLVSGTVNGAAAANVPVTGSLIVDGPAVIRTDFVLKTGDFSTYQQLHDAVNSGTGKLIFDLPDTTVTGSGRITLSGAVSGAMTSTAYLQTKLADFNFLYAAKQNHNIDGSGADGADFLIKDTADKEKIQLTLNAVKVTGEGDWETSKSKTASPAELSGDQTETTVTLSLPSAEYVAKSDIVFLLDKSASTDHKALMDEAKNLIDVLAAQEGTDIKVGVIEFAQNVTETLPLTQLTAASAETVKTAMNTVDSSGTNILGALRSGAAMLKADTEVTAANKYVILLSDGGTTIYEDAQRNVVTMYTRTGGSIWRVSNYDTLPGGKYTYASLAGYGAANIQALLESGTLADGVQAPMGVLQNVGAAWGDYTPGAPSGTTAQESWTTNSAFVTLLEKGFYLVGNELKDMKAAGYNVITVSWPYHANTSSNPQTVLTGAFMDWIGQNIGPHYVFDSTNAQEVMGNVRKNIVYLLGSGTVTDVIADKFDLVTGAAPFTLTVAGTALTAVQTGANEWSFGDPDGTTGKYPYVVNYDAAAAAGEQFVWTINVPVERTKPVQLSYKLRLNDLTKTAAYPTNASAELDCVDSDGNNERAELFEVPQVTYTKTPDVIEYTLTYVPNGGSPVGPFTVPAGTVLAVNQTSTRDGYTFEGWYADEALTQKVTSVTMDANKTVYAKWTKNGGPDWEKSDHFAYIIGYPDGNVHPEASITRAETATIFFRLMTDASRNTWWNTSSPFSDVVRQNWFNNAISTMANAQFVDGYPDGTFGPDRPITRAEFAVIAARANGSDGVNTDASPFSDLSGHWAEGYIKDAAEMGLVDGYADGTFKPDAYITRAEAMTLVNRFLGRDKVDNASLLTGMITWPDNMDTNAWYYCAVQEATNSHSYTRRTDNYETWTKINTPRDWDALETIWSTANSGR